MPEEEIIELLYEVDALRKQNAELAQRCTTLQKAWDNIPIDCIDYANGVVEFEMGEGDRELEEFVYCYKNGLEYSTGDW